MEFILKIKSKFNSLLTIEKNLRKSLEKNSFQTFKINLDDNENFLMSVEPTTKTENLLLPYNVYIKNEGNKLVIESPNVNIFSYKNVYLINLEKLEVVKDMKVMLTQNNFSVFNTFVTNVTTSFTTISLPKNFNDVKCEKYNNYTIIYFDKPEKYVVVFNQDTILFKDYYSQINKKDGLQILTDVNDFTGHSILTKIENKNVTRTVVYKNEKPKLCYCEKLIPTVFLQALKIDNLKLCKHYLDDNLSKQVTLERLKEYFGNFIKAEADFTNGNSLILFYENKNDNTFSHKTFNFELEANKIVKIDTI